MACIPSILTRKIIAVLLLKRVWTARQSSNPNLPCLLFVKRAPRFECPVQLSGDTRPSLLGMAAGSTYITGGT
jgi:hypothetical protein